jgi:hypothetical protein
MSSTKEVKEVRKRNTPAKLSTDLPRANTGLNRKVKDNNWDIIDMTNSNSPDEQKARIPKRPKGEYKVPKNVRVKSVAKNVEPISTTNDKGVEHDKHSTTYKECEFNNSPYLLAPDFRDISPSMEFHTEQDEADSESTNILVIKVLTSNLSEIHEDDVKSINDSIDIINNIAVTNNQRLGIRENIQLYYLQEKIGYLELTNAELNRWKELMYVSLIEQFNINQDEVIRTGHHFKHEDTDKLKESVIMNHLLKVLTTDNETLGIENLNEAHQIDIPTFIRVVIKIVDGEEQLDKTKSEEYWKRTLLKLIGDCYDQIDSVNILLTIKSVIEDDNSLYEEDNTNMKDSSNDNDNNDETPAKPDNKSCANGDSNKRNLEFIDDEEEDIQIKRGRTTSSKLIMTPERCGNEEFEQSTNNVDINYSSNIHADKEHAKPRDACNTQADVLKVIGNNEDNLILTEEKIKTMFNFFMSEFNKNFITNNSIPINKMVSTNKVLENMQDEHIDDMENSYQAGLMVPQFHYGDTPEHNAKKKEDIYQNEIVTQMMLNMTDIRMDTSTDGSVNTVTKSNILPTATTLAEISTIGPTRSASSHSMGVQGLTTCVTMNNNVTHTALVPCITNNTTNQHKVLGQKSLTKAPPSINIDTSNKVFNSNLNDSYTDSILDDSFDDSEPENDMLIDMHSNINKEKLVKDSVLYLGELRCQPYSTYFNVNEDYIHPSNSKALRTQITVVLDKCQLYGNIGSITTLLEGNSIDLHIDLYGSLCNEIKSLPFTSIIDKKLLSVLYINSDERSTNIKELSMKPHIFLSKHIMEYPIIEKVDYRVIKDIHSRMKQVYYEDESLVESCRFLRLPLEKQYEAIKNVIKYTNKVVNLMFKPHWNKCCIEVTSRSSSGITLNDKEKFVFKHKDTVFNIDVTSVFNELKNKYMDLMTTLFLNVLRLQLMIYVQNNNTTKPNSKDQRRVWMLNEYKGIPFPLPKTFFKSPANTLARAYEELTCKDLYCKLQESIFSVYAVTLSCKLHELCLSYNKINSFRVQIFESAIIALPIALKENLLFEHLPPAAMELLQMNYNMILYMCTDKCLAKAIEIITTPKDTEVISELDNLLIEMNKENIALKLMDVISIDLNISIHGLQMLEERRRYSKQRKINKAIKKKSVTYDNRLISASIPPVIETDKDIAASMVDNSSLHLNSLSRLLNTVEHDDDDNEGSHIEDRQKVEADTSKDSSRLSPISSTHEDDKSCHSLDLRTTSTITTHAYGGNTSFTVLKDVIFRMNKWLPPMPKRNKQVIHAYCVDGAFCENADCSRYHPVSWTFYSKEYSMNPSKFLNINDIKTIENDWKRPPYNMRIGQEYIDKNCWYGIHCKSFEQQNCAKLHPEGTGKLDYNKTRNYKNNTLIIKDIKNNHIPKSSEEYAEDKVTFYSSNMNNNSNSNVPQLLYTAESGVCKKVHPQTRVYKPRTYQVKHQCRGRMEGRQRFGPKKMKKPKVKGNGKRRGGGKIRMTRFRTQKNNRDNVKNNLNIIVTDLDLIDNTLNIANTGIHNLTKQEFTKDELFLLSLGLKFKLPFKRAHNDRFIMRHHETFARSLRCSKNKLLMHEYPYSYNAICLKVRNLLYKLHGPSYINNYLEHKSSLPSQYALPVEKYISDTSSKLRKTLRKYPINKFRHSTKDLQLIKLYKSIDSLKRNKSIIIKPTDKNLGIAVIDISEYDSAMIKKLDNGNYMACEDFDINLVCIDLIKRLIKLQILRPLVKPQYINYTLPLNWRQFEFEPQYKEITQLIMYYFSHPDLIKLCRLKLLPKVHKTPMDWREICANPKWITSIGSLVVHILLYPLLQEIPSYIHNSSEIIIELMNKEFSDNCTLLQADIESMYPSIDIEDGLNTLDIILSKDGRYKVQVQELILNITEWVLYNNYMSYNGKVYKQINGTSMGTSLSVTYSCLYISHKENQAIDIMKFRKLKDPLLYKRLIDDCAGIFIDELHARTFMQTLEHVTNDKIKFDYKISNEELVFLDMTIFKGKDFLRTNTLSTKLYQKANNKYLFIPPFSAHSVSVYRAWIEDYIKRIRILCSIDQEFEYYKALFYNRLLDRGFREKHLKVIFDKIYNRNVLIRNIIDRNLYKKMKDKIYINNNQNSHHNLVLPGDYRINRILPRIKRIMRHDKHIIKLDEHYSKLFPNKRTRIILQINKNVEQLLNSKQINV